MTFLANRRRFVKSKKADLLNATPNGPNPPAPDPTRCRAGPGIAGVPRAGRRPGAGPGRAGPGPGRPWGDSQRAPGGLRRVPERPENHRNGRHPGRESVKIHETLGIRSSTAREASGQPNPKTKKSAKNNELLKFWTSGPGPPCDPRVIPRGITRCDARCDARCCGRRLCTCRPPAHLHP